MTPPRSCSAPAHFVAAISMVAASFAGCDGCRDTPAVPFAMDGGSAAPAPSAAPSSSSAPFQQEASAPVDPGKLTLDGRPIDAPDGKTFTAVLVADGDADGVDDAFAWAKDASGGGELLFFAGKEHGEARSTLHAEKGRVGCAQHAHLRRAGRETVTIEVTTSCTGDAGAKEAAKIVVVHLPEPTARGALPETRLVLERKPSPPGERLELTLGAEDRDGDGREDLVVRATLHGAPAPFGDAGEAAGLIVAIDRPAGYTLDPSEPEATFEKAAADLVKRATVPAEAPSIADAAASLIRLQAVLCGDLGAPLVSTTAGAVRCGEGRATVDALVAQGLAAIATKDLARAFSASAIVRALGDRKSPHVKKLVRDLDKLAPIVTPRVIARVPIEGAPSPLDATPPFAFDPDGKLVVMRGTDVVRVEAEGAAVPTDVVPWPRGVAWSSQGAPTSLVSVVRRCGPSALVVTTERGGVRTELPLPDVGGLVAPSLWSEPCTAGRVDVGVLSLGADRALLAQGADVFALKAEGEGLAVARAQLPLPAEPPGPPGGARSADGTTSLVLTEGDALVLGPAGARRWRAPEIASASACAPRATGDQVACVGARTVVLLDAAR